MTDTAKKVASSNWLTLKKTLKKQSASSSSEHSHPRKRRKLDDGEDSTALKSVSPVPSNATNATAIHDDPSSSTPASASTPASSTSLISLRNMIHGSLVYTPSQTQPGKYLAIDCEMVGIGLEGTESSLARVSLVNWYGAVQLDVFVRQRERVVDYRTQWSGIREKNMVGAKPFEEVQRQVADLIRDRILTGHAIHNDLKALLLSHPRPLLRDTQVYARKFNLTKSKYIALRNLVKDQIGVTIQEGEHNSVTDARATMAIYRLHKKEWENGVRPPLPSSLKSITDGTTTPGVDGNAETKTKKRKRDSGTAKQRERTADDEEWIDVSTDSGNEDGQDDEPAITSTPTPKTKSAQKQKQKLKKSKSKAKRGQGISSGLSTVIKQRGPNDTEGSKRIVSRHGGKNEVKSTSTSGTKKAWWAELPNSRGVGAGVGATAGKKGSMRVTMSS